MKTLLFILLSVSSFAQVLDTSYCVRIFPTSLDSATIEANLGHFPQNFATELQGQIPCGVEVGPIVETTVGPAFDACYCYQVRINIQNSPAIVDSCFMFDPILETVIPCGEEQMQTMDELGPDFDIPAVGTWGLIVLSLLLLIVGVTTAVELKRMKPV